MVLNQGLSNLDLNLSSLIEIEEEIKKPKWSSKFKIMKLGSYVGVVWEYKKGYRASSTPKYFVSLYIV